MHRYLLVGLLLLAGCQNIRGPFARQPDRVDDPYFTISEQERRGRNRLSLPDDAWSVGPPTRIDRPGPAGR